MLAAIVQVQSTSSSNTFRQDNLLSSNYISGYFASFESLFNPTNVFVVSLCLVCFNIWNPLAVVLLEILALNKEQEQ